jgi:hypothetical protein
MSLGVFFASCMLYQGCVSNIMDTFCLYHFNHLRQAESWLYQQPADPDCPTCSWEIKHDGVVIERFRGLPVPPDLESDEP